jgi:hypothetical protein
MSKAELKSASTSSALLDAEAPLQIDDDDLHEAPLQIDDDDLYDIVFVCRYFGGTRKPLHPATIYRAVADGRISRPIKAMPNANRWLGREIKADRQRLIVANRGPLPSPRARAKAVV